ncbi:unnamed protein product [Phytophthora lilii]|uniref:Unnamed protein product n=1 Tax=Phytophthora lilii TaxID=2077276 RepID=A0A9W6XDY1_9STRA|nr:unnamed protein product [Phytophthora lilii]
MKSSTVQSDGENLFVELKASSNLASRKYLYDYGIHDPELFGIAYVGAAKRVSLDMVKWLFSTRLVSSEAVDRALQIAAGCRWNANGITRWIYSTKSASREAVNRAFKVAVRFSDVRLYYENEMIYDNAM